MRIGLLWLILAASLCALWRAWQHYETRRVLALVREALRQFHPDEAIRRLNALTPPQARSAEVEFLLAAAYRRAGRLTDVAPHLEQASELGWNQAEIDRQYCLTFFQAGDFRRSGEELLDRLHERASDDEAEETYEALARGYMAAMLLRQADFVLEGWISWRPKCLRAHLMRADVAALAGSARRETDCYRDALRCDPTCFQARRSLAKLLLEANEIGHAMELYDACRRDRPNDPNTLVGLAECEQRSGRPRDAQRLIDQALAAESDSRERSEALLLAGQVALAAKNYERASQSLRQAVELYPANLPAVYSLSQALTRAGRRGEGKTYLVRWQRLKSLEQSLYDLHAELLERPEDASLRTEIGVALLELGASQAGANLLISALLYEPDNAVAHRRLAEYYQSEGQADLAAMHQARLSETPDNTARFAPSGTDGPRSDARSEQEQQDTSGEGKE